MKRNLTCPKCNGIILSVQWEYKKEAEIDMLLCHDGYGFQLEDAFITCIRCKFKGQASDFIALEEK